MADSTNAIPWKAFIDHLLCVCDYAKFLHVLPYVILISQPDKVDIFLPTFRYWKSPVRLGNLTNELVSQVGVSTTAWTTKTGQHNTILRKQEKKIEQELMCLGTKQRSSSSVLHCWMV